MTPDNIAVIISVVAFLGALGAVVPLFKGNRATSTIKILQDEVLALQTSVKRLKEEKAEEQTEKVEYQTRLQATERELQTVKNLVTAESAIRLLSDRVDLYHTEACNLLRELIGKLP